MTKSQLLLTHFFSLLLIFLSLTIFTGCEKKEKENDSIRSEKIEQSELLLSEDVSQEKARKEIEIPDELTSFLGEGYVIYAIIEGQNNIALLLAKKTNDMKLAFGDYILLILSNNYEVITFKELYSRSTDHPIYYDASNFAVGFYNNEEFKDEIYIFNINEGIIKSIVAKDRDIANIFLNKKQLYYSTDRSYSAIKRIDLVDNEIFQYRKPYLANASFVENEGIVYAIFEKQMYEITDDKLIKTDIPIPKSYRKYAFRDFMSGDFSFYEELLGLEKSSE